MTNVYVVESFYGDYFDEFTEVLNVFTDFMEAIEWCEKQFTVDHIVDTEGPFLDESVAIITEAVVERGDRWLSYSIHKRELIGG